MKACRASRANRHLPPRMMECRRVRYTFADVNGHAPARPRPREAGRSETRSSRRQRPWGGSCIPARHQINQRCHRRTRGSDAKSSSTKRKTRSGLNDPSDRVAVAAPEDFAAPSTNDRICDCGGAWKAAAAQQTYFCERAQRELGISATGSMPTFAADGLSGGTAGPTGLP